jgi:hypothetical protein
MSFVGERGEKAIKTSNLAIPDSRRLTLVFDHCATRIAELRPANRRFQHEPHVKPQQRFTQAFGKFNYEIALRLCDIG